MAMINLYQPMNLATTEVWFGQATTANSSEITINNGFKTGTYLGSFSYDFYGNLAGGTATEYRYYEEGILQSIVRGANANALTVMSYLYALDQQGLQAYVFRDDDFMTGTSYGDGLVGYGGNDTIDGAGGTDTTVYTGKISDYLISYNRALGTATIWDHRSNADGTDTLKSIEKLQFSDKTFDLINLPVSGTPGYGKIESFLFDAAYYLLKNPELVPTVTLATAYNNYKSVGAAAGDAPNAWFDPVYYANKWADLKALNLDAATLFQHYNLFGVWEGRSAGPVFDNYDGNRYLADNPDVAVYVDAYVADFLGSRSNGAIAHYVIYGANEGRIAFDTDGHQIEQVILIGIQG